MGLVSLTLATSIGDQEAHSEFLGLVGDLALHGFERLTNFSDTVVRLDAEFFPARNGTKRVLYSRNGLCDVDKIGVGCDFHTDARPRFGLCDPIPRRPVGIRPRATRIR